MSIQQPLAERMRPKSLDDYLGQKHLVAPGAVLRNTIESGKINHTKHSSDVDKKGWKKTECSPPIIGRFLLAPW